MSASARRTLHCGVTSAHFYITHLNSSSKYMCLQIALIPLKKIQIWLLEDWFSLLFFCSSSFIIMGKLCLPKCTLTKFHSTTTYVRKVPRLNVLQTNQGYPARSVATGVSRIMLLPLRYFDMVRPASLLTATVLDWAMWDVSAGSLAAPRDEQKLNIEFCVKLGNSFTETYNLILQV